MRKQARFIYANAYNSQFGLLGNRVSIFNQDEYFCANLTPLSRWCEENFFSVNQARRFIRQKKLLALKYQGKWYVRLNPYCTLEMLNASC
jgi:hypothetical protein